MFDASAANSEFSIPVRRKRIWEINRGWHCSIVGTSLNLGELRGLARKLGLRNDMTTDLDYRLHGHFVREAGELGKPARMLDKLLDRKHAGAIRRFQRLNTTEEVSEAWTEAFQSGDVPGPYWAVLSHPHTTTELGTRVYSDVHMLSHLVGASNRADLSVLRRMEIDLASLEERYEKQTKRHHERLDEKDSEIDKLRQHVVTLTNDLEKSIAAYQTQTLSASATLADVTPKSSPATHLEIARLKHRLATTASQNDELRSQNRKLSDAVPNLEAEVSALETALSPETNNETSKSCPFDLNGRCILYVGGRAPSVCRMRDLVSHWNGELVHHDGGLEKSLDELSSAVIKADAVVFPTDCVSHQAMHKLKRLCQQSMKPYVPLRSSGVASFVAGLREAENSLQ